MANPQQVKANIPDTLQSGTPATTGWSKVYRGVTYTDIGEFSDAVERHEAEGEAALAAAKAAKGPAGGPLLVTVTDSGKLSIRYSDKDQRGMFGAEFTGDQWALVTAHLDRIQALFAANRASFASMRVIMARYRTDHAGSKSKSGKTIVALPGDKAILAAAEAGKTWEEIETINV